MKEDIVAANLANLRQSINELKVCIEKQNATVPKPEQSVKADSTLSKILCKWKQDSVISFFLYLDSAFKYKHKLVHNQSPV